MNRDHVAETMRTMLVQDFEVHTDRITDDATFRGGLGMDSYATVDFVFALGERFGIPTELEAFRELTTFGAVVDHVLAEARAAPAA